MTFQRKLLLGVSLMVLPALLIGVQAIRGNALERRAIEALGERLGRSRTYAELETAMFSQTEVVWRYLTGLDPGARKEYQLAGEVVRYWFDRWKSELGPDEASLAEPVWALQQQFEAVSDSVFALVDRGERPRAYRAAQLEIRSRLQPALTALNRQVYRRTRESSVSGAFTRVTEIVRTEQRSLIAIFLVSVIAGLVSAWLLARSLARPIRELQAAMAIVAEGDLEHPVEARSRDEIGDLTHIFNNLSRNVYEAQQRLREKIDLAGTALMKTNEQLQQRSQELEQRSQDLEKALNLVEKLAVTDSLTDLRNRRYFDDNLATSFARALRFNEPLALLLIDIDYFKNINDTYGHAAGDTILQTLSGIFKSRTRETDISARLGGDEFSFLLYRTNREAGLAFGEELLARTHELEFSFLGQTVKIGLSIGVACNWDDIHSIEALYGAADEALYEAKRRGRNQVVAYPFDSQAYGGLKSVKILPKT